ncbi:unnamed protein product [Ectocarpus sp. CCAP 1310/34]|nr:unnamed protein product [Ectocarpus sp. CCAP 1310/34]
MDHLLEAYASSSSDDEKIEENDPKPAVLGALPSELLTLFKDSEYDLATERRRAEERAGNIPWVRRFPHERGNWPTHVFIPVPNSSAFKSMAEASVSHFRQRLAAAWRDRHGRAEGGKGGRKRTSDGRRRSNQASASSAGKLDPPEVVMNNMDPSGRQHLSLSKTTALRAHQIDPFVQGLKDAVKSSRRVRGGRKMVLGLIAKVDPLMRRFKQSGYYEEPIVHVSVASVLGDVSTYVSSSSRVPSSSSSSSSPGKGPPRASPPGVVASEARHKVGGGKDPQEDGSSSSDDDEDSSSISSDDVPSEVCLTVDVVMCKAGTTYFEAPLAGR